MGWRRLRRRAPHKILATILHGGGGAVIEAGGEYRLGRLMNGPLGALGDWQGAKEIIDELGAVSGGNQ